MSAWCQRDKKMNQSTALSPIDPRQRLVHVDMIRGFALFGVLLVNMFNFGAGSIIWIEPIDEAAFSISRFLFETKSWRLFSFLFGFGFALQFIRADERGSKLLSTYAWRLVILFVFGMANALLYDGDILMYYAELGLVLILFRKVPPKVLVLVAAALLLVFPVQRAFDVVINGPSPEMDPFEIRLERAQGRMEERLQNHPYAVGTIGDVMVENAQEIPPIFITDVRGPESVFGFFAMFLLGLAAGQSRILHDLTKHKKLFRYICGWGLTIGLLCMTIERVLFNLVGYELFGDHRVGILPQVVGDFTFNFGATALALGYAASIVILAQYDNWRRFLMPLAAVGRMALSIYLLQTLMFSTLFYGYGFGQVGRIGPAAVFSYAVLFFVVHIIIANWWLRRYRFGPAEWLWRSLTYRTKQPMRL